MPGLIRHELMRSAKSKSDPSNNDSGIALVEIYEMP